VPSANTGKEIVAVKPSKKKVWIYFVDGEKLGLAPSVYADFYLYVGKSLSEQDYRHVKNQNELGALREYAYGLLALRSYSKKQMIDRMYKKKASRAMIDAIIEDLLKNKLIDDEQYVEDFLEYAKNKHYGKNKIMQELFRDGIDEELIEKVAFDDEDELEKAKALLPYMEKKFAKCSFRERQKRIYDAYMLRGFSGDTIERMSNLIEPKDNTQEQLALKRDYEKALRLYNNRFTGYKLKTHIVSNLAQKGYNYSDIEAIMEEAKHVMDQ
jgi:regulatory protein